MNVIAVDVGTTNVRSAIIAFHGPNYNAVKVLANKEKAISHHQDGAKFEQNSREIWEAVGECSRFCVNKSGLQPNTIHGIAFSATCSLVVAQNSVEQSNSDIIMWMDHRALKEAQEVTDEQAKVLDQFGGVCSPEFSLAKLLWLKNNEPTLLESALGIFELPDWLVYKCIGGEVSASPQSLCCVTCKWGYDADSNQHCDYINSLGSDIIANKMGQRVLAPGTISGILCDEAAEHLGLSTLSAVDKENVWPSSKVIVGTSLIDAHSGMLAMLSAPIGDLKFNVESTFCSLAGTSTCHMTLSKGRNFFRGIWGPYKNVVIDNYYLLEAGQSMTGKLIDMCIESHEEGKKLLKEGHSIRSIVKMINEQLMQDDPRENHSDLHILPTFHGNRSPLANPRLKGGVYGLTSDKEASLKDYYIATTEATIYEIKFIVETLGIKLDTMLVSGGLMKNFFYMQTLADALDCQVVKMALDEVDFMVMGSGLIARHAVLSAWKQDVHFKPGEPLVEDSLSGFKYEQLESRVFKPRRQMHQYHDKKYSCYRSFVRFSQQVDEILNKK